jgi:hypothetical protein
MQPPAPVNLLPSPAPASFLGGRAVGCDKQRRTGGARGGLRKVAPASFSAGARWVAASGVDLLHSSSPTSRGDAHDGGSQRTGRRDGCDPLVPRGHGRCIKRRSYTFEVQIASPLSSKGNLHPPLPHLLERFVHMHSANSRGKFAFACSVGVSLTTCQVELSLGTHDSHQHSTATLAIHKSSSN